MHPRVRLPVAVLAFQLAAQPGQEGLESTAVKTPAGKGLPVGTALAFMMSITALSLPEMVILRKVMKPRLLATFTAIVAVGIITIGYLFNWLAA